MPDQRIKFKNFANGLSDDDIVPPPNKPNVASDMTAIDFRTSPGRLSLQKAMATEASGSGFKGPRSYDGARIKDGTMYFANGAYTYKRTPGANGAIGTYAEQLDGSGNSIPCADLDYRPDLDKLFLYTANAIHELSPLSNSPTYKLNKYSYYSFLEQAAIGSTTALSSSVGESATTQIPFTCTREPLDRICFLVANPGSGIDGWTVIVHDAANTTIASQTIAYDSKPTTGDLITFNNFTGSTRLNIGAKYHIHLVDASGTASVVSSSLNNLSTATVFVYANRLVTTSSFVGHATHQLGADTYFCNERYIGQWEFLDTSGSNESDGYNPHAVALPADYLTVGMTDYNEYLVTACAIPDSIESTSGSITGNSGHGCLVLWDTTSSTFNSIVDVPQGVPEGVFAFNSKVWFIARGRLYSYDNTGINLEFEFPDVDTFIPSNAADAPKVDTYLCAGRHCMTVHEGLLKIGFPFQTANANIKIGIYSYGSTKAGQIDAMGFDYVTCSGVTTTSFDTSTSPDTPATGISLLTAHSGTLLAAWTNGLGSSCGIDRVNDTSAFATSAMWRSMWRDNAASNYYRTIGLDEGDPDIEKTPKALKVTFQKLATGCTVTPFIQYDQSGTDITGVNPDSSTIQGKVGDVDIVLPLDVENGFYQVQCGVNLASSSGNNINVISLVVKYSDNTENTLATENRRNAS